MYKIGDMVKIKVLSAEVMANLILARENAGLKGNVEDDYYKIVYASSECPCGCGKYSVYLDVLGAPPAIWFLSLITEKLGKSAEDMVVAIKVEDEEQYQKSSELFYSSLQEFNDLLKFGPKKQLLATVINLGNADFEIVEVKGE